MTFSLQKKLTFSLIAMLLLILSFILAVRVITMYFKDNTDNLIIEYHELHALQETKLSLNKLTIIFNNFSYDNTNLSENNLTVLVDELYQNTEKCHLVLTKSHNLALVLKFDAIASRLDKFVKILPMVNAKEKAIAINSIRSEIIEGMNTADILIAETREEIYFYEKISSTAILHGSYTIVL